MIKQVTKRIPIIIALAVSLAICTSTIILTRKKQFFSPLSNAYNYLDLMKLGNGVIIPYSYPVALSSDGSMLLVKTKTENAFELSVYNKDHLLAKLTSKYNPWQLTWDPSGKCISYLVESDSPGIFLIKLWWIDNNKNVTPPAPVTRSAGFPVRWSPDGHRLTYVEYCLTPTKTIGAGRIVILKVNESSFVIEHVINGVNPLAGYAWSEDSQHIAFSTKKNSATIDVYSLIDNSTRTLVSLASAELKDLSWAPSSRFVVAAVRKPHDEFYRLVQISLAGVINYYPLEDGDAAMPVWSDDILYYVLQKEAHDSLCARSFDSGTKVIKSLQAGLMRIQNDGYKHMYLPVIAMAASRPPELFVVTKQSLLSVAMGPKNILSEGVKANHIWIPNDRHAVPAWLWNKGTAIADKAVVIVHGGVCADENGNWEPLRQAFASSGFTVLAPNYSGSTGYGARFEIANNLDTQCEDLVTSIHYLESRGISKNHIVIVASSNGTQVLFQALRQEPALCGMIVVAPLVALNNRTGKASPIGYDGVVLAFHGLRDPMATPETALGYLEKLFGHGNSTKEIHWRVFADEAHDFSRISSLQEIYGTVISTMNSTNK